MAFNPNNPNGQATSANSAPVVIASDQSALLVRNSDGTNTANVIVGDTGQNSQLVAGARKEVTFSTTTVQAVGTTEVSNYRWVSVHTVTQGSSSTITFQGSNDNTNWVNVSLLNTANVGTSSPATNITTANRIDAGALNYRYFRLNVTGISAGTTAGVIELFSVAPASLGHVINISSTSATAAAVPANAFYLAGNAGGTLTGLLAQSAGDTQSSSGMLQVGQVLFNGTNYDRMRSLGGVSTTATTGLMGMALVPNSAAPTFTTYSNTALSTTVSQIKATTGRVYDVHIDNSNASLIYIQFFDVAAATTVTLGTTAPTFVLAVAATGVLDRTMTYPYSFTNGIKIAATTTPTGAVAPGTALNITLGYV